MRDDTETSATGSDRPAAPIARFIGWASLVVRGPVGLIIFATTLSVAGMVGGSAGLLLASGRLLFAGTYCLANFWCCRETHCVVTGPAWTAAALLGFAAVLAPGSALVWYVVDIQISAALAALAIGYALECVSGGPVRCCALR